MSAVHRQWAAMLRLEAAAREREAERLLEDVRKARALADALESRRPPPVHEAVRQGIAIFRSRAA